MISKFTYLLLFLILTVLHICANLKPTIEANASIKTINLQLTRKLNLYVGYEYQHKMFWQAFANSVLLVIGLWRCQCEVDRQKQRYCESFQPLDQDPLAGGPQKISAATEVKLNWIRKNSSSWQLFPMRYFIWFALPWLLTLLFNNLFNYVVLNMVMRHFCISPSEVYLLNVRVQLLYLQRLITGAVAPFLSQFSGAFESLIVTHANSIVYESKLLVGDE